MIDQYRIRRITNQLLILGLFLTVPAIASGAETDPHRAAAQAYLSATNMAGRMERLIIQIRDKQVATLNKWYIPAETQGPAKEFVNKASKLISQELSWKVLENEFIAVYASIYTQEELEGLVRFYGSELGQKYLAKRPALVAAGLDITESRLQSLLPKLEVLSKEFSKALKGHKGSAPTER
jgi:hypothetical protein